ncbi:MAG: LysM peptidoglycan-binding domain-containing protein, partial [Myxococcaceae bacterium]|nr:LysM peptidoglycan-binding domain-containing protein [Myxococcaceae bacterium]
VQLDEGGDEGGGDDDTGGGPPEGSMRAAPAGEKAGPGTQHTVERGDTLWDLSQKYLGSPWYWPKVWSYNPEIANPHWIYPGNVVRFVGSGEETPTQVEMGSAPDVSPTDLIEEDAVQLGGKIGYVPQSSLMYRAQGFVTKKEIEEAGTIAGSFSQSAWLSSNQGCYLKFKNSGTVKIGDRVVIFRPAEEISNPRTGDDVGYLTQVTGIARVTRTDGPLVTAWISDAYETIERGNLVAPYSEALAKRVAPKPNDKKLDATLVAMLGIGTYITVIIDKGSDQGVQPGNVFTFVRRQDGLEREVDIDPAHYNEDYPDEEVGHCIAWEVKTSATSCVVVSALLELAPGDIAQMRVGGANAPRASR